MDTTLMVMAAGIGSRFGGGIKQLEPIGPNGEIIMDYSIYDAMEAGFNKVVFIIRKDLEKDFREVIGNRIEKVIDTAYAFQEMSDLPEGFRVPEGRKKPWGTGQAVLSAKGLVNGPFCVINADDYYGKEGFQVVHDYMVKDMKQDSDAFDMCMAGFILKNTLSENGGVTRGVCRADDRGILTDIEETFEISMDRNGVMTAKHENGEPAVVTPDQYVSMNLWGLPESFLDVLDDGFREFLKERGTELKSEYLLPGVIGKLIAEGKGTVRVLPSHDRWFGVTYKEDKEYVVASMKKLIAEGKYPEKLWK